MSFEESFEEQIGEISLTLIKYRGFPGAKRWDGEAWAYWGGLVGNSESRYRSRRAARRSLIAKMNLHRGTLGADAERTVAEAKAGVRNFEGRDLDMIDLREMELRRCKFDNTNLSRAKLSGSNLLGSNFTCANMRHVEARNANFAKAILTGAHFYAADLTGASFSGASHQGQIDVPPNPRIQMQSWLGRLNFIDCDLSETNFDNSKLGGVFMKRCDLSGTSFRGADLENARILDCEIDGVVFDGANLSGMYLGPTRPDERDDQWF